MFVYLSLLGPCGDQSYLAVLECSVGILWTIEMMCLHLSVHKSLLNEKAIL